MPSSRLLVAVTLALATALTSARPLDNDDGGPITAPPDGGAVGGWPVPQPTPSPGCVASPWAVCGGTGWTGCVLCPDGTTCRASNEAVSMCVPSLVD